jgi:hypothetical protein
MAAVLAVVQYLAVEVMELQILLELREEFMVVVAAAAVIILLVVQVPQV